MGKISVVINTLNEENNLPRAIASIKGFADEIIVCDMNSDDKTVDVAKKFGAKVFEHERTGYVEPARNFAISKATGDWVLILDADEELQSPLVKQLKKIVADPHADYYRVPRKNMVFGKWIKYSRWWPDYNIRFFKKGSVSWSEVIHTVPETIGKGMDLEANEDNAIIHHHYENIEQYIERLNRYTTYHSKSMVKNGYKFDWRDLIKKPVNEFLSRYFQAEGYKDGLHGMALAGLQAFSEFVVYLKVWQSVKFEASKLDVIEVIREMKGVSRDVNYWQADMLVKEKGGITQRIKRKFKLP